MNTNQLPWNPLHCRICPHRILSRPLEANISSPEVHDYSLAALFPPCPLLNSTMVATAKAALTFTSSTRHYLFVMIRLRSTPILIGSSTICVRKFSSMLSSNADIFLIIPTVRWLEILPSSPSAPS